MPYNAWINNMKKILILLLVLLFTNSCITVVFEPYMVDEHKDKSSEYPHGAAQSSSDEQLIN